ncbi:putative FASCICLIN-like arabinogalactan protein 21 precursor [Tripterygium wilfordii]|uniref:Putative FASCICLIN-like arabinogalactan protein 21 n=1 Tax=Tripterygium wilfordii TaxID=458696 RepID=A0A7J7BY04_TRIWF|nr:fasciclin-like arabinogalactan protein 21 [Tripterygium wilfordii]KAF5726426.1 putative FASCICLIN-like arabinogalactan protein 21 precursor [Tripterygium wilfordii]
MASSNCWQAPIYITVSVVLAFFAISTALHSSPPGDSAPSTKPITHKLSLNASRTLRKSGFKITATLLQISPEIFLSSPNTTIFAVKDSAIANSSSHPWLLKDLLQYHISPLSLSISELLKKSQGSCLPTLLRRKNIAITKVDAKERVIEINHVLVSHPDLFLEGPISIHGVLGPFFTLDSQNVSQAQALIHLPGCQSTSFLSHISDSMDIIDWTRIIRLLSSNGFVSFAIGLNSVLDEILQDHRDLKAVTIFTPPDFAFVAASPSPLLHKIVRFHIVPKKLTFMDLASLPEKTLLRTMVPDQDLEITGNGNITQGVNGVDIAAPDLFSSKKFIIHGVSQAFQMTELPNASR